MVPFHFDYTFVNIGYFSITPDYAIGVDAEGGSVEQIDGDVSPDPQANNSQPNVTPPIPTPDDGTATGATVNVMSSGLTGTEDEGGEHHMMTHKLIDAMASFGVDDGVGGLSMAGTQKEDQSITSLAMPI